MNIVKRLAIKNLKLNKKRTISTVIGIILSTALICGTTTLVASVQKTLVQNAINQSGYYHVKLNRINADEMKEIEQNRDIKDKMIIENLGYGKLKDCQNPDKPYVKVLSTSEKSFNELMLKIEEGRYPENPNEIIIGKHIATNGGLDLKIGDKIKVSLGERKTNDDYDLKRKQSFSRRTRKNSKRKRI